MSLLKSIFKIAKPLVGSIPGIGPALSAGLGVAGSLVKGGEQNKAQAGNAAIQAENSAALERRFQTGRGDARDELARMIAENDDINADMASQTGAYNDDVRSSRTSASQTIEGLLNEIRNSGVDINDPDTIREEAYVEDNSDAGVLRDRAAARARGERDSIEAATLQRQMMTEAGQKGPSADALSALIAKAGGSAITRSFEDSGNKAAMELSRTGGNGADTFSKLARERAEALKGNDVNAALAGLQGAEDLAGAKASRLSPMIAALSARSTAMPDASAEMQGMAIRGQAKQANQSMNANIRSQNATNKLTTQGQRVSQATAKSGQLASMAPAAMLPSQMRLLAPTAKRASGGLNMSYMGPGVGQNGQVIQENNTGSGILEGLSNLAGMIPTGGSSSVTPINATKMLADARLRM